MTSIDQTPDIPWKIIDALDDRENNLGLVDRYKRNHVRCSFRQSLMIYRYRLVAGSTELDFDPRFSIAAWSRDLTVSGIGFVSVDQIMYDEIAIQLGTIPDKPILVRAIIKRKRRAHENIWEYGAEFQGKIETKSFATSE